MIKAEEMGTNRVAGQGTVCLEMRVVKSRRCSFIMLCSFCWVGFSKVTGLIRTDKKCLFCVITCNVLGETVKNKVRIMKDLKIDIITAGKVSMLLCLNSLQGSFGEDSVACLSH